MNTNVIYVGIDVDDVRYHGSALDRRTGEVLSFHCRPTLKGGLGIRGNLIGRWKRQLEVEQGAAFPGRGKLTPEQQRIRELEEENRRSVRNLDARWSCRLSHRRRVQHRVRTLVEFRRRTTLDRAAVEPSSLRLSDAPGAQIHNRASLD